jgi:hypothetical protein
LTALPITAPGTSTTPGRASIDPSPPRLTFTFCSDAGAPALQATTCQRAGIYFVEVTGELTPATLHPVLRALELIRRRRASVVVVDLRNMTISHRPSAQTCAVRCQELARDGVEVSVLAPASADPLVR